MIPERRAAGILLHISSLPNQYGIGTMGRSAYKFVDLLADNGIKYWQILPLVQTSYGDSPYQSAYSGSGNPYFIDLEILAGEMLLKKLNCRFAAVQNQKSTTHFYIQTSMRSCGGRLSGLTFKMPTLFPLLDRGDSTAMLCLCR